ncbi:MAG: Maf family protein [Ruminococcus sp.]|nr:Maf family protein [Ruminococcus sp.]
MTKIILASQSPRRRELLTQIGLEFEVRPSSLEESVDTSNPVEAVKQLSFQKASDIANQAAKEGEEDCLIVGSDTIVVYDNQILGKPENPEHAEKMLDELQGNEHSVFTGVTLIFLKAGTSEQVTFAEETRVSMLPMTKEEIKWYVDSKEPLDKAGSYGIQGLGARYIEKIHGDYNNVVGLPICRIYQELKKRGEL